MLDEIDARVIGPRQRLDEPTSIFDLASTRQDTTIRTRNNANANSIWMSSRYAEAGLGRTQQASTTAPLPTPDLAAIKSERLSHSFVVVLNLLRRVT